MRWRVKITTPPSILRFLGGGILSIALVSISPLVSSCHLFLADVGAEGQPCFDDGTCLSGLVCDPRGVCVTTSVAGDGGVSGDIGVDAASDGSYPSDAAPDGAPDSGDAGGPDAGADATPDASFDAAGDAGTDAGPGPQIISIDGTGPEMGVSPRPEDEAVWNAHAGDRVPAQHRIEIATGDIVVTGDRLAGVTKAVLKGQDGQGNFEMTVNDHRLRRWLS